MLYLSRSVSPYFSFTITIFFCQIVEKQNVIGILKFQKFIEEAIKQLFSDLKTNIILDFDMANKRIF